MQRPLQHATSTSPIVSNSIMVTCRWISHIKNILKKTNKPLCAPWSMSLRRCEWRVWFRGQTTSKPSIHTTPSYGLRNCVGNPEDKTYDQWHFSGWENHMWKMKGLIVHPIMWEHLCGIFKVPKVSNGIFRRGTRVGTLGTFKSHTNA